MQKLFFEKLAVQGTPALYLMIGIPASGKSTVAREIAHHFGIGIISRDEIRKELSGNERNHDREAAVTLSVRERIRAYLAAGRSVILDTTSAKARDRREMTELCRMERGISIGIWVKAPLSVCLERNAARQEPVPQYVIFRHLRFLRSAPPCPADGFTKIIQVDGTESRTDT